MASHFFLKLFGEQEEDRGRHSFRKSGKRTEGGQEKDTKFASMAEGHKRTTGQHPNTRLQGRGQRLWPVSFSERTRKRKLFGENGLFLNQLENL